MIGTDLNKALDILRADGLVAIPTETVYGLAGNALSSRAVAEIFAVKQRPSFDPLIIHLPEVARIDDYVLAFPETARVLATTFMPGPLTLVLPKRPVIPDLVTAGSSSVAVRIPDHDLTLALLRRLDFPLAAPSANPFGYISPTCAEHVAAQLGDKIPYILDGGPCRVGLESTIVGFPDGHPTVLRKGGIAVEAIEAVIGKVAVRTHSASNPQAPGMLQKHYAPRTPFVLEEAAAGRQEIPARQTGLLRFREQHPGFPADNQFILSPTGDFREAAQRLFSGMRQLDAAGFRVILAELLPEKGLGRAINDRLRRAAAEHQ